MRELESKTLICSEAVEDAVNEAKRLLRPL